MLNEGGQSVNYMYTCIHVGYTEKINVVYEQPSRPLYMCFQF